MLLNPGTLKPHAPECDTDDCGEGNPLCFPIRIPGNDQVFPNKRCFEFTRSKPAATLNCRPSKLQLQYF